MSSFSLDSFSVNGDQISVANKDLIGVAGLREAALSTEDPRLDRSTPLRPSFGTFRELLLSKKETAPCDSG